MLLSFLSGSSSGRDELKSRQLLPGVVLLLGALFAPAHCVAEIIVDDFNDLAQVAELSTGVGVMPYKPVVTETVGDLSATRELSVFAAQTVPVWSFDSNSRAPSSLSAELHGHDQKPSANSPIISFTAIYLFSPIDLTEDGANDALLFDLNSHQGSELPLFFRAFARGASPSESCEALGLDFRFSPTPFTSVIPFSAFGVRGGGPGTPNFSTLDTLIVNVYFLRPSEEIQWSVELDRIRIGKVSIPEPRSVWLGVVGVLVWTCAGAGKGSLAARRVLIAATLIGAITMSRLASAEIIIDDFTDAATVIQVSTGSTQRPAVTEHVGDLDATRELLIYARSTNPIWSFDSAVTMPSLVTATLNGHTQTNANRPVIEFKLRYNFAPIDLTEQGTNNAFVFDFASHQGTEGPLFLRITALGASASESYAAFSFNLPFSETPFTAAIPFNDFTFRGGGAATPDFSTLQRFFIDFFFFAPSEDIEWSAQLDRIRIDRVPIPEPNSLLMGMVGVLVLVCSHVRQRYRPHPNGGSCDAKKTYFQCAGFVARSLSSIVSVRH